MTLLLLVFKVMPSPPKRLITRFLIVLPLPSRKSPLALMALPLISTRVAVPVLPSIVTASVMLGRPEARVIVGTPLPRLNWIASAPDPAVQSPPVVSLFEFELLIASRSVHWPSVAAVSAFESTVIVAAAARLTEQRKRARKIAGNRV